MNLLFAESEARIMYQESISISEELYFIQRQIGQCFSECKMAIADASKMTTYEARLYGEAEDGKPSIFKRIWEKIKSILKTIIKYILKFVNGVLGLLNKVFGTSWKVVIKSVNGDGESSSGGGGGSSGGSGSSGSSDSGSKPADENKPSDNPAPPTPTHDTGTFIGKFMQQAALGNALREIENVLPGFNEKVISEKDVLNPLEIINKFTDMIKGKNANLGLDTASKNDVVELMKDIFSNISSNMDNKDEKGKIIQMNEDDNKHKNSANVNDDGELSVVNTGLTEKLNILLHKMKTMQNELMNTHSTIAKYASDIFNTKTLDSTNSKSVIEASINKAKTTLEANNLKFAFSDKDNEDNTFKLVMANMQEASGIVNAKVLTTILSDIYKGNGHGNVANILPEADKKTRIVDKFSFASNSSMPSKLTLAMGFATKHKFIDVLLSIYANGLTKSNFDTIETIMKEISTLAKNDTKTFATVNAELTKIQEAINAAKTAATTDKKISKDTLKNVVSAIQNLANAIVGDINTGNTHEFTENGNVWSNTQHKIEATSKEISLADLMVNDTWFDNDGLTKKLYTEIENYKKAIQPFDEEKGVFNNMSDKGKANLGEIDDVYRNEITKMLKETVTALQKTSSETNKYIMTLYKSSVALSAVKYNNGVMRFVPQYQAQAMAYALLHSSYATFVQKNNESLKKLGETFVQKNREIETAHNEFVSKLRIL